MRLRLGLALVMVVVLAAAGCGDDDGGTGGPESEVVQEVVDQLVEGGMERDVAECFAGKLIDEFGVAEFIKVGSGEQPSTELMTRSVEILTECAGGAGLDFDSGDTPSDFRDLAQPRDQVDGPYTYGDDPDLDDLWDECEAGSGSACDTLFFQSPVGSEYEAFGNTCGNRMELDFLCSSLDE